MATPRHGQREMDRLIITYCDRGVASSMTISSDTGACTGFPVTPSGAPAPRRSSGAPPVHEGPVTPSREGWLTSRTWKGQDRAGEQRAAHRRRPADTRPGVRSAAQRVAGGAPQPDRLRRPGRSSSRRLRCCRKVAPPLLHDRPLRLRPDGAPPAAATMTAAAAPAVGKKDLACCRREPTARAEEHSPEAACVTCSCRSRRWATSYGK